MIVGTNANICGSECVSACTGVRSCVFVRIVEVQGSAVSNLDTLTFTYGHAFTRTQAHEFTHAHARTHTHTSARAREHTHTHKHTHTQQANTRAIMILRSIVWKPSSSPTFDLQVEVCALACGRMLVFHVCASCNGLGPAFACSCPSVCLFARIRMRSSLSSRSYTPVRARTRVTHPCTHDIRRRFESKAATAD